MAKTGIRSRTAALAATASAALVLAACGGGDEETSAGESESGEGGSETLTVLRTNGGHFEPIMLGQEEGIWADHGLEIDDQIGADSSAQRIPPLMNGEAQIAQVDGTAMIRAVSEGLPVQIISGLQNAPDGSEDGFEAQDGLVVPEDSEIESLEDLEGATIGVPALGATVHVALMVALEDAGVDPESVEFVALPGANLLSAAEEGQVDGSTVWATFYGDALAGDFRAVGPSSGESIPGLPQITVGASTQYIAENGDVIEQFTDANAEATEHSNGHPDDRRRLMSEVTELPQDYIDNVWLIPYTTSIDLGAVQTMADALERFGFIDEAPAAEDIVWSGVETQ